LAFLSTLRGIDRYGCVRGGRERLELLVTLLELGLHIPKLAGEVPVLFGQPVYET